MHVAWKPLAPVASGRAERGLGAQEKRGQEGSNEKARGRPGVWSWAGVAFFFSPSRLQRRREVDWEGREEALDAGTRADVQVPLPTVVVLLAPEVSSSEVGHEGRNSEELARVRNVFEVVCFPNRGIDRIRPA